MNNKKIKILIILVVVINLIITISCSNIKYNGIFETSLENINDFFIDYEYNNILLYKNNKLVYFSHPIINILNKDVQSLDFSDKGYLLSILTDKKFLYKAVNSDWLYPEKLTNGIVSVDENGAKTMIAFYKENFVFSQWDEKDHFFNRQKIRYKSENSICDIYNTLTGCIIKINVKNLNDFDLKLKVQSDCDFLPKSNGHYITFESDDKIEYIFQAFGIVDNKNVFSEYNMNCLKESKGNYLVSADISDYSEEITMYFSLEKYTQKNIIDSQVSSKNENQYLKGYCLLGNSDLYGFNKLYMRFSTIGIPNIKEEKIKCVKLRIKKLSNSNVKIKAYVINEKWCSWTIDKNNCPKNLKFIGESILLDDGYYYIDITDLYKKNIESNIKRITDYGICLENDCDYAIIPTADNSIFPISVVIEFS